MKPTYRSSRGGRRQLIVAVIVLLLLARFGWEWWKGEPNAPPPMEGEQRLVRVADGDTLLVRPIAAAAGAEPPEFRLRLLGIDAPESVKPDHPVEPFGPEASEFARQFTQDGLLRLQYDNRREDQYGRRLAYVYVGEQMLNEELVRAGLARVNAYREDSAPMTRLLEKAEAEAKAARRGIWSQ